ncbi:nucleoside triphosphate pyrophosphohydrolase [Halalkalibacillus sediminis]|uniref:Nucleoside triphosphate pyrophosphohydrolase n=1 Tax=Halalkalibacillus sediminis TaxID=2018042 RepID=A0A2I0QT80_9BACI|nr:nucleoside triphosphate pyrophosphohydrolase [Halalkalibacillus sediminis]PKR77508.1 nucleoside triphosphate pyrophosphohydrolase [Halalkalibacillus sediminis]
MGQITVIGLGSSSIEQMPLGVYRELTKNEQVVFTRTLDHPVIKELMEEGTEFHSFDHIYENEDQFEAVYDGICQELINQARSRDILYTVPGHPMVAERTVQLLLGVKEDDVHVEIKGGQSFLDALFTSVGVDPIEGFQLLDGTNLNRKSIQYEQHLFIAQVYDQLVASEVKLTLLEDLPHDHPIKIIEAAGSEGEKVKTVPLHELDHDFTFSNLVTLYVPPAEVEVLHHQFSVLRNVIAALRGPGGCPWDQKQTHESLRKYLIEEAYEVIDAIEEQDDDHLAEELGDVLLQVMLHSQIAEDEGYFTVDDVIRSITDKMIKRHPHVFGDVSVESSEEVKQNWEAIKQQGRAEKSSVLEGLNESLPRLTYAHEMQKKASKVGFDWPESTGVFSKLAEELKEFEEAASNGNNQEVEEELGDVLFTIVNISRHLKVDPEVALHRSSQKFLKRFQFIEKRLQERDLNIEEQSLDQLEQYWNESKREV